MAKTITIETRRRELAHRASNGIDVTLYWGPTTGEVVVEVIDHSAQEAFELAVPSEHALDAFHHPFAYAAMRGVEYGAQLPQAA